MLTLLQTQACFGIPLTTSCASNAWDTWCQPPDLHYFTVSEWSHYVCPTLCDPIDNSLLGSAVHGIFQARILEWAAISFSRESSQPRDRTQVSCIADRCFTIWATREAPHYFIEDYLQLIPGPSEWCPLQSCCVQSVWLSLEDLLEKPIWSIFADFLNNLNYSNWWMKKKRDLDKSSNTFK